MLTTSTETPLKQLLNRIRSELNGPEHPEEPTRAARFDLSFIVDVLEQQRLSLSARALLAWVVTRETGRVMAENLHRDIVADRVEIQRALMELERAGFAKRVRSGWEFSLVPTEPT